MFSYLNLRPGRFSVRLLILNKKGKLLQLKFVGVGVNIYLWAQ